MNVLVIGSDSFIARKFINSFCNILNINSFSRESTGFKNEVVISDYSLVSEASFQNIDVVINFAAIVHRSDIKDENLYYEINHKLPIIIAEKAKKSGVALFIQMSTIAVYGDVPNIFVDSTYLPKNIYGKSKMRADIDLELMQSYNFKVAIIRAPMIYGGGLAPGNMLKLIKLVNYGFPLPFKGVNNSRDFLNVNNLIQYLFVICDRRIAGVLLLSDNEPTSSEDLINIISKQFNKKVLLFNIPSFIRKLMRFFFQDNHNKLFGSLIVNANFPLDNLIVHHSLEEGINEMVTEFKKTN